MKCIECGADLTSDDIGCYLKFKNRMATEYKCIPCFAVELKTTEEYLRGRVEFLKRNGCRMFPPEKK